MPFRNNESLDDLLVHARALFGEESIEDNENVIYGPLTLSVAPKEGKANTLLADQLFSPSLYIAERIERALIPLNRRRVVELGAGCALPSLFATTLPEPPELVVVTDYPDEIIIGNLKCNVERNKGHASAGCKVHVQGYEWGKGAADLLQLLPDPTTGFDVVILSDLLHFNNSHEALVESVNALLSADPGARVYISAGKYTADTVCRHFVEVARGNGILMTEEHDDSDWQGSMNVSGLDIHGLTLRKLACFRICCWDGFRSELRSAFMGIAGLLPALKPIQVTRCLSEFAGHAIAVDAYVWLHKGIYSCATELATGKPTHKYVDYAMHRVRLLRHHKIEPYIVFDGGPLPAKQGTERERKQRRDEYLARGKALASQGKHAQAREFFVKCIDVTPQMAYQLIKALRAENVPYVVAPYEADAQLAYLERIGLADAILTEDSDLLVYGCKTVLFKLDVVAATVVSISRKDFASVTLSSSEISLVGWSDVQFRAMAILSGCDYLPSIHGIGLKTACSLLRKWKTVAQAVKILIVEGKKSVPKDYLRLYEKAEKCFLHQRVYCPLSEKLVHLTEVDRTDWSDEHDAYVGRAIDPHLAKKLALGDIDPISLLPMNDVNPAYTPKVAVRTACLHSRNSKGKARQAIVATPKGEGILDYFGDAVTVPHDMDFKMPKYHVPAQVPGSGGKSGKRTLVEVVEQDIASRKQKKRPLASCSSPTGQPHQGVLTHSKFFNNVREGSRHRTSSPADISATAEKENFFHDVLRLHHSLPREGSGHDGDDEFISEISNRADDGGELTDLEVGSEEMVKQEEGYISPLEMDDSELSAPELSSPVRPSKRRKAHPYTNDHSGQIVILDVDENDKEDDFGAETLSSPPPATKASTINHLFGKWEYCRIPKAEPVGAGIARRHSFPLWSLQREVTAPTSNTPRSAEGRKSVESAGPSRSAKSGEQGDMPYGELQKASSYGVLSGYVTEVDDTIDMEDVSQKGGAVSPTPSPSPETPTHEGVNISAVINVDDEPGLADEARVKAVIDGWKARWARPHHPQTRSPAKFSETAPKSAHRRRPLTSSLKRSETNVTPCGRHSLRGNRPRAGIGQPMLGRGLQANPHIDLTRETGNGAEEATNKAQFRLDCFW